MMVSQLIRQSRHSRLLAAAENAEGAGDVVAVYECKHCDKITTSENEIFEHVQDRHQKGRKRSRGQENPSEVLKGLIGISIQKVAYVPESVVDVGSDKPTLYSIYHCTLCQYRHLSSAQVRKHGTMCHFLEIPVFSCLYCKVAVADRDVFHHHFERDHRYMKVDFSFDCKALTLLNQFLSESLYQIHVGKEAMQEVIKDRSENFVHYTRDKVLDELIPKIDELKEKSDSSSGDAASTSENKEGLLSSAESVGEEKANDNNSPTEAREKRASTKVKEATPKSPSKSFPKNTVRAILDSMVQKKGGTKKKYLRGAVKDLLKEIRQNSAKDMEAETSNDPVNVPAKSDGDDPEIPFKCDDGVNLLESLPESHESKEEVGSSTESQEPKKKVERLTEGEEPKKMDSSTAKVETKDEDSEQLSERQPTKRGRGRPRKTEREIRSQENEGKGNSPEDEGGSEQKKSSSPKPSPAKRGRGRPRKTEKKEIRSPEIEMKGNSPENEGRSEKKIDDASKERKDETTPVRRKRGRPSRKELAERDNRFRIASSKPQLILPHMTTTCVPRPTSPKSADVTPKKAKTDLVSEDFGDKSEDYQPGVTTPTMSPGRYNFRNRSKNKLFIEDLEKSDEEEEDVKDEEKPGTSEKTVRNPKLASILNETKANEVESGTAIFKSPVVTIPSDITRRMIAQGPLLSSLPTSAQVTTTFAMINGRLVPVINSTNQALQEQSTNTKPIVLQQAPRIVQIPQPQQQSQPMQFSLPSQPNTMFTLLPQQQQQQPQMFPVLNQSSPVVLQQAGGSNVQILPQTSPIVLGGSLPNLQGQAPFVLRSVTPVQTAPNVITLHNPTPLVQSVATTPNTSVASSSKLNDPPAEVKPIVIEPKDNLDSPPTVNKTSKTSNAQPGSTSSDTPETSKNNSWTKLDLSNVKVFYIELYVCRNCKCIFLSSGELNHHIYLEELTKNPSIPMFSQMDQKFFKDHTITPLIPIYLNGNEWNIPVVRCSSCSVLHILESYLRKHVREHADMARIIKESLWQPADITKLCTRGWSTKLMMKCRERPDWADAYTALFNSKPLRHNMKVPLSYLKKIDIDLQDSNPRTEGLSPISPHPVVMQKLQQQLDQASGNIRQSLLQPTIQPAPKLTTNNADQLRLQNPLIISPTTTPSQPILQPQIPANQLLGGMRILQVPNSATRIIQLPPAIQPTPPMQLVSLPTAQSPALNLVDMGKPQSVTYTTSEAVVANYSCKKCSFQSLNCNVVKDHVLEKHMDEFGPAYKCTGCNHAEFTIAKITDHIMSTHQILASPFQVNRLYDPDEAAKTLIASTDGLQASAKSEGKKPGAYQPEKDTHKMVERVEPDSSCDIEAKDPEVTASGSNLLSAPNILSCLAEEEDHMGNLGAQNFLGFSDKRIGLVDEGPGNAGGEMESENQTGEAYACRLCAYSCDTEQRIKSHLMSQHISSDMYPFTCMSCSYEAPSTLRLAQHVLYKHRKQDRKNPPKLAKDMEKDAELWPKIMRDAAKYERFQQELDCLFRNCVEIC